MKFIIDIDVKRKCRCGSTFIARRPDHVYCTNNCSAKYRARKRRKWADGEISPLKFKKQLELV